MHVHINNPVTETLIFIFTLTCFLIFSSRKKIKNDSIFPLITTQELKGLALLFVIFSHIGYFLVDDNKFLFPLSILAGVGVNLFLLLSGFGLSSSFSNSEQSVKKFYLHELPKLYIPLWCILSVFIFLDFIKKTTYSQTSLIEFFIGFFPQANIYQDINSPLWYFTLILFYYLIFPFFFNKKYPWLSSIIFFTITFFLTHTYLPVSDQVKSLYSLHTIAFPVGIFTYWLLSKKQIKKNITFIYINISKGGYFALISLLIFNIFYTSINSYVGQGTYREQIMSIFTTLCIFILFIIKRQIFTLLSILGIYSYEIYLVHWPLMYRYDYIYSHLNPWLATIIYLYIFIFLGWMLKNISRVILSSFNTLLSNKFNFYCDNVINQKLTQQGKKQS